LLLLTVTRSVVGTQQFQQLGGLSWHLTDEHFAILLHVILSLQSPGLHQTSDTYQKTTHEVNTPQSAN